MFPAFVAAQNLDLDAQEIDRHFHFGFRQARHAHRVLLRRHDHGQITPDATSDKTPQFRFRVVMMIDVLFRKIDMCAQRFESALKTVWHRDSAD